MLGAPKDMDDYIARFPKDVQSRLGAMRRTIKAAAPKATETISDRMPTFRLRGKLVHFAAFSRHIGFHPTSSGIAAFKAELAPYKGARGSVQFPLDQTLPLKLVAKIVRFRVKKDRPVEALVKPPLKPQRPKK